MKGLPLSLSSFEAIRKKDLIYVDKTKLIYGLAKSERQYFLARPRRFGKSLLISTLESLFGEGTKYFDGLWIKDHWTDKTYKVIHLDFSLVSADNAEKFFSDSVRQCIRAAIRASLLPKETNSSGLANLSDFFELLEEAAHGETVNIVLLIDEYDAPLNANLTDPETFAQIQKALRFFYAGIKRFSGLFRFVFITGVSRFRDVSIFSAGSSIVDLSLAPEYGTLMGYTEQEIRDYFRDYLIKAVALISGTDESSVTEKQIDQIMDQLREHYDGYCFDEEASTHVFQTWSVLNFFNQVKKPKFADYWYVSGGLSALLLNYFKSRNTANAGFDDEVCVSEDEFSAASTLAGMRKEVLLTQCGYYTIKRVDSSGFTLGLPNLELRHAKARLLTGDLFKAGAGGVFSKAINAQPLQERNAKELADLFNAVLKTLSAKSSPVNEHQLRDLLKIYFLAAEADVQSEKEENGGRADLTFEFDDIRLIVEFKFARHDTESPRLLESAIKQISNHDYGNYVPLKRLRRFAMVYSAPKCKITLAEELRQ